MSSKTAFHIPKTSIRVEQEIKRSKFITSVQRVDSRLEAKTFIEEIRAEFPDARHHCSAFLIGNPASTTELGQSDDGEPQGTAGKPMLNVLQHKDIGNIAVVVTRYFGGIKLGTGGLVRAYSSSVQQAIDQLPLKRFEAKVPLCFQIGFPYENTIRSLLSKQTISITQTLYSDVVSMQIHLSASEIGEIKKELENLTRGDIIFLEDLSF